MPPNEFQMTFFFFLVGLEFELRALHLQTRHSTAWAIPPVYFAMVILELGVLWTICPGWPPTVNFLISAFQVARIIGMGPSTLCFLGF
jgi:hypothetical protein